VTPQRATVYATCDVPDDAGESEGEAMRLVTFEEDGYATSAYMAENLFSAM